jgi:hypothetical protein
MVNAGDEVLWQLVETPCATEADFLAKIAYMLEREHLELRSNFSYRNSFGALVAAIELHLGLEFNEDRSRP